MKGSNLANDLIKQCDESDKIKVCAAGHTVVVDDNMSFFLQSVNRCECDI